MSTVYVLCVLYSEELLQEHMKAHLTTDMFACPICPDSRKIPKSDTMRHIATEHPQLLECTCLICTGETPAALVPFKTFQCKVCQLSFCKKFLQQAHNWAVHGAEKMPQHAKVFTCHVCGQVFFSKKAMYKHGSVHTQNREVVKPSTKPRSNDPDLYEPLTASDGAVGDMGQGGGDADPSMHVIHVGQDTQYLPRMSESNLNAVIKELILYTPNLEHPYRCILCNRHFNRMKYIKLHIRRSHVSDENQPYRCKVCGSGFVRLTEFRKHTRSHSDFRPFKCKFCNKAFKQQANMKEHLLVHSSVKQYECKLCGKWFRQRGALTSHVVLHDTLKPFRCTFCGRGYTTRGELSKHMKNYEAEETKQEKSYSCHLCMKSFPHFPLLIKHIEQHNPDKPFKCEVCDELFMTYVARYFHKVAQGHVLSSEVVMVAHKENPSRLKYKPHLDTEEVTTIYMTDGSNPHGTGIGLFNKLIFKTNSFLIVESLVR